VKRLLSLALLAVLATGAVSCADSTGPGTAIAGTYTLRSVGGTQPPVQLSGYQIISSQIVLDAAGNYSGFTVERDNFGTQTSYRIDGYWSVSGNQIYLYDQNFPNDPYVGSIDNDTIVIYSNDSGSGYDEIYQK
jgi:hypothetical protein